MNDSQLRLGLKRKSWKNDDTNLVTSDNNPTEMAKIKQLYNKGATNNEIRNLKKTYCNQQKEKENVTLYLMWWRCNLFYTNSKDAVTVPAFPLRTGNYMHRDCFLIQPAHALQEKNEHNSVDSKYQVLFKNF